jgi:threonylcarbamoyladenosine tRNA methylthiotransferase MtaB
MRIAFATLGCKINQYDTDELRRQLSGPGTHVVPFEDEADAYVINTCSVTEKSDRQCRQMIRAARRRSKSALVVVTGCYARTRPEEVKKIEGVDAVFGAEAQAGLVDYIRSHADVTPERAAPERQAALRTRGVIKIQTGCDNRCSYCIVPDARGPSKSVAFEDACGRFTELAQAGCAEIVLTGIHIGMYGVDLIPRTDLSSLLVRLNELRGSSRIRLSSIEPNEVSDTILSLLGNGLCRHLHIPLQSGDDSILAAMKRTYTAGFYRELLERIAKNVPGVALGADVMVGFPGEGEREFLNTKELIESSPLTHLHVFSYSPRPGTPAADMRPQVAEEIKKERSSILRRIAREKSDEFKRKHLGSTLSIVVEDAVNAKTGTRTGLTDNYIRVQLTGGEQGFVGKIIDVKLDCMENADILGIIP